MGTANRLAPAGKGGATPSESSMLAWVGEGAVFNGRYGHTVGTAGDIDGDGLVEILIGEQRYSNGPPAVGRALVYTMGTAVIQRSTYSMAGQTVAIKVSGDPHPDNNGIFFIHSDHLGSTSALSYGYKPDVSLHPAAGDPVPGSESRYLPFGGWRTQHTAGLTDRGFTGHKMNNLGNNDLGLIYMSARYYSPCINRFASADTIVPNPADPQSFNRYSYTRNNPMTHT